MTAERLVDCHRDLAYRAEHNRHFRGLIADVATRYWSRNLKVEGQFREDLERLLESTTRIAYLYQVAGDMTALLAHAAASLDETDVFDRDLAPTAAGLVRFEQPLIVQDYIGGTVPLHWVAWGPATLKVGDEKRIEPAIAVYLFNDRLDDLAAFNREMERTDHSLPDGWQETTSSVVGRWFPLGAELVVSGVHVGPSLAQPDAEIYAEAIARGDAVVGATNIVRIVHALWLLLGQTIVDTREAPLDRAHRKIAVRARIPGRVTVVTLRRHAGSRHEGESQVEWSHRWVVRGHWRWQPYGPGRTERRRIWIAPFVKGPDDAPLVCPEKVYRLTR